MAHETKWEENGIYMNLYNTVNSEEIFEMNVENSDNPRVDDINYFIWDSSNVKKFEVEEDDANLAAIFNASMESHVKNIKGAYVINDKFIRTLINKYIKNIEKLGSTWTFMIFDNLEDARKWIA